MEDGLGGLGLSAAEPFLSDQPRGKDALGVVFHVLVEHSFIVSSL